LLREWGQRLKAEYAKDPERVTREDEAFRRSLPSEDETTSLAAGVKRPKKKA